MIISSSIAGDTQAETQRLGDLDMAQILPDYDMVDRDTPTAIKLPYPEFSVLEDGKEGKFLPQIGGDTGAERVYRGW